MFSINAITMLKSSFSLSFYLQAPKVIFAYQILKNLSQLPKAKNWNTKFVRIRWSNVQRRRNTICRMYSMKQYALSKRNHMWKHACVRYSKQAVVQRTVSAVSNSTMDNAWIERRLALNLATRHLDNNAPYNYHSKINMFHWILIGQSQWRLICISENWWMYRTNSHSSELIYLLIWIDAIAIAIIPGNVSLSTFN